MIDETINADPLTSLPSGGQAQPFAISPDQTQQTQQLGATGTQGTQSTTDATQQTQPTAATVPATPTPENKQPDSPEQSPPPQATSTAPASGAATPAPNATDSTAVDSPKEDPVATLDLIVHDWHNDPIPNMDLRVLDISSKKLRDTSPSTPENSPVIFNGKTNGKGQIPLINGLKMGTRFEVQIKKDSGAYTLGGIGTIDCSENTACLKSPKVKFEISTYAHEGDPGLSGKKKQQITESHVQKPDDKPNISRNPPDVKPQIKPDRNSDGNPKAVVKDGLPNMWGQNSNQVVAPNIGKTDLDKVKALVDFATEQASWKHTGDTSATIIDKMKAGTYQKAGTKEAEGYLNSVHRCTKYVKIALWKAGYSHNNGDIAPKISPAREMGPPLEEAGFQNITANLPDARWAAPGDIIVYEKISDPSDDGHIDIRTYDGYISDFIETYLPVTQFKVTGIYRKYYDPMPEKRMRAFLKVLRTREAGRIKDDQMTYYALPDPCLPHTEAPMFSSFATHPFDNKNHVKGERTSSGAYQITLDTWRGMTDPAAIPKPGVPVSPNQDKFTKEIQDRIAIALMELAPSKQITSNGGNNALSYVRKGDIESAVKLLRGRWASLPGAGSQSHGYTMEEFKAAYDKYLSELS